MNLSKKLQKIFEIRLGKHLRFNIWLIAVITCAILGGYAKMFVFAYLSAVLHELAHILCAKALKVAISDVTLFPFGISARLESGYIRNSEKEFLIALSGPFFSLIMFWACRGANEITSNTYFSFIADTNLALCAINLIPALPLDGGRALKAMLTSRYGIIRSYNFMLKFSKGVVFIILGTAAAVFFIYDFNFSLILISAFLLQNLSYEQQAVTTIALKEILSNSQKAENTCDLPVKTLCVTESRPASGILRHLSYDCFYTVHVLDKESRIIKTFTETQILTALTKYGIRVRFSDL